MADLYALTEKDVATLKQLVKEWRHDFLDSPHQKRRPKRGERCDVVFGVVDSSVAGTSDTLSDPPSGTMSVYNLSSTGATTDSGLNETVYNLSSVALTTSEYTLAVRDYESGLWLARNAVGALNSVAVTTTVIPGRSGTTPGGPITVTRQKLDDLVTPAFVADGTVDVYSWIKSDSSDPASEDGGELYIFIEQDAYGVWWFTGQDCPPEA